jgi:S-formylglutathione hydrolase FrmB
MTEQAMIRVMKTVRLLVMTLLSTLVPTGARADDVIPVKSFSSAALGRDVDYSVFVPQEEVPEGGWPLVLLLHGAGRHHRTLADDPATREVILKQKVVIVFADGKGGWYLDSPVDPKSRYQSMLGELLVQARKTLPVSPEPKRTGVCGWSMGGYGSMRFAQAFHDEIGAVATTIALLDFPNPKLPKKENYTVPKVFGTDPAIWAKHNPMNHIDVLRGKSILIVAANQAFDTRMNRNFHAKLESAGIAHEYREVEGGHTFPVVQATVPMLLEFLAKRLSD